MTMKKVEEDLIKEELQPLQEDEKEYYDAIRAALSDEENARWTELDYLTVIRGYKTYEPRMEETIKAAKMISDWRVKVGYYRYLHERIDKDEEFHGYWKEDIYGEDMHGHPIIAMHVNDINTEALGHMDSEEMLRLQGQKQTVYLKLKADISERRGEQKYKYVLIVDLKGTGMSILGGKKRGMIQKIFDVGADNFPESIWKIFVVNTPFIFRTVWAIIKPWIHPITQAKVNIIGSAKDAVKKMKAAGISEDAIPEFLGGTCKALSTFDYMLKIIEENQQKESEQSAEQSTEAVKPPEYDEAVAQGDAAEEGDDDDANEEGEDDGKIAEDVGQLHLV